MTNVNKTLYIPLYGKSKVSAEKIILSDKKAEEIWNSVNFPLKGKSKSKWLAYFMAMRARVYDDWATAQFGDNSDCVVLHIGCGLDSRVLRCGIDNVLWYDIDFPDVISERRKYFTESDTYKMIEGDASNPVFTDSLPQKARAVVILEGICMYLKSDDITRLFLALQKKFGSVKILMDVYTGFGARITKLKNPINDVGVNTVYGVDDPEFVCENRGISFVSERDMTPEQLIKQLPEKEQNTFRRRYAGKTAKKIYRLFEYKIEPV